MIGMKRWKHIRIYILNNNIVFVIVFDIVKFGEINTQLVFDTKCNKNQKNKKLTS